MRVLSTYYIDKHVHFHVCSISDRHGYMNVHIYTWPIQTAYPWGGRRQVDTATCRSAIQMAQQSRSVSGWSWQRWVLICADINAHMSVWVHIHQCTSFYPSTVSNQYLEMCKVIAFDQFAWLSAVLHADNMINLLCATTRPSVTLTHSKIHTQSDRSFLLHVHLWLTSVWLRRYTHPWRSAQRTG